MPIHNLSDRNMMIGKAGNIRKGIKVPAVDKETNKPKKTKGQIVTYPKEVEYFVFKPDEAWTGLAEQIVELYTLKPKTFVAFLASSDIDKAWDYWLEAYNFNQLIARADRVLVTFLFDTETNQKIVDHGQIVEMPSKEGTACFDLIQGAGLQLGDLLAYYKGMIVSHNKKKEPILFDAAGRLNIVLRDLSRRLHWTVHTGGLHGDVPHITQQVKDIFEMAQNINMPPTMIPFSLTRVEVDRNYKDDAGKQHRRKGWNIMLEVEATFFSGYLEAYANTPLALAITQPKMLEAPKDYVEDAAAPYIADEVKGIPETISDEGRAEVPPSYEQLKQDTEEAVTKRNAAKAVGMVHREDGELAEKLVELDLFDNNFGAQSAMSRCKTEYAKPEKYIAWAEVYRDWKVHLKTEGQKGKAATEEAIKQTNDGKRVGVD